MTSSELDEPLSVIKLGQLQLTLLTAGNCSKKHQLVDFEVYRSKTESKSGYLQIERLGIDKRENS